MELYERERGDLSSIYSSASLSHSMSLYLLEIVHNQHQDKPWMIIWTIGYVGKPLEERAYIAVYQLSNYFQDNQGLQHLDHTIK